MEGAAVSLDPSYLEYPRRGYGYDHALYPWSALHERAPVKWRRGSVAVWVCISLEWFPITPSDTPFRAPGHMATAYPDFRHYTARDYGNRIGAWRFLDALLKAGAQASFAEAFDPSAWADWFAALDRSFLFLLILPFVVAVVGLWAQRFQADRNDHDGDTERR